jgi:hypothetical protein
MRLKRSNPRACVCAIASFVVLAAMALTVTPALALPEGRTYEMVSPVYKAGYSADNIIGVAPDGESVAFPSRGGFAGLLAPGANASNYYLARRGEKGWSTASLEPPFGVWADLSSGLEYALGGGAVGPNTGYENHKATQEVYQLHRTDAPETPENWGVFGDIVLERVDGKPVAASEEGASADLCHLVLEESAALRGVPGAVNTLGGQPQFYDLARGCGGEPPSLRLVGLNNNPTPTVINRYCQIEMGSGADYARVSGAQESNFNAVAGGGGEMFFTSSVENRNNCQQGILQLFVRLGGSRTLEVSRPLEASQPFGGCVAEGVPGEVPCEGAAGRASASFSGASEGGSRVFFTTKASLTGEDKDTGNDLYMASIDCPGGEAEQCEVAGRRVTSLVQVSHDLNAGQPAEVQGVVKIARDGSHVYFVARGALSEGSNAQRRAPVKGADNLYVYDSRSGKVAFVADLCSGPELSGTAQDVRCPSNLESGSGRNDMRLFGIVPEAQTNNCPGTSPGCEAGRFLVFSTYAQLVKGDTDSAKDVYRYDTVTGMLDRVSIGEAGHDANGNDNVFDATISYGHVGGSTSLYKQYEMDTRAISEDGSRIVFSTAAPLSPDVINGLSNVYEWHLQPGWSEGTVSIVSSGSAEEGDENAVISPSGRDIFFTTVQGLVSQDTDGARDVYDAHECTTQVPCFPPVPAERQRCEGDACYGPLTNPAPLLVPGSVSQAQGQNVPPQKQATVKKKAAKAKKKKKKKTRKTRKTRKTKAKHARQARKTAIRGGGR